MKKKTFRQSIAIITAAWLILLNPVAVLAADATGGATGAPENTGTAKEKTGPQTCTGAGCGQGARQGENQGADQGGLSRDDFEQDEEGNIVGEDTRQGALQGASQNDLEVENSNTGANSDNTNNVSENTGETTAVNNNATDRTNGAADATTGLNSANANSGDAGVITGNASISATVVKNDNSAVVGGTAGLQTKSYDGDHDGDLDLEFGSATADLSDGSSVLATNKTTGSNSNNENSIESSLEKLVEIQNDGLIENNLDLAANTGDNEASSNTGGASIATGDANVAATLINLLNTAVINGDLLISVTDVFGNLNGNINVDSLGSLAATSGSGLDVDVENSNTGADSNNETNIDFNQNEEFNVSNDADVSTDIDAEANTGDNEANKNTGGGSVGTGDANVQASNTTIANTTVEGGNWGLFIVNALNGFLGFLVGDDGTTTQLSQSEVIREIEAQNSNTGADSNNVNNVSDSSNEVYDVVNNAVIDNNLNLSANTGRNAANKNTGAADIATGDANVQATAINLANTTVKDGSLFIGVVNVFGDWFGDLFYDSNSLLAQAGNAADVSIDASNNNTGADSNNEVNVNVDQNHTTTIENEADLNFTVDADVNTGGNRANKNTLAASVETGDGLLAVHSRAVANIVGIAGQGGITVDMNATNSQTGFESKNKIKADINSERVINVNNDANISTVLASIINTGENEANKNTGGANISTGNAGFTGAVDNLVNQVVVALADAGVNVDAEFVNELTGALSENSNDLSANYDAIINILNNAGVDNIIDLLLNTGNNKANSNTGGTALLSGQAFAAQAGLGGGHVSSGAVCVTGSINNVVNQVNIGGGTQVTLNNNANVNNNTNIVGNTGGNQQNNNTVAGSLSGGGNAGCDAKIAQATPTPEPVGGGDDEDSDDSSDDSSGGDSGSDDDNQGSVAASVDSKPKGKVAGGRVLSRFPVAGAETVAQLMPGNSRINWIWLSVAALLVLAAAYHLDKKSKINKSYV